MKKLLLVLLALPLIGFGQNVNIPDANFKAYLVGEPSINTNGDTEIQVSEAAAFTGTIGCSSMNISNLTGIEAFTALTDLSCGWNQLTSLNVSQNTALTELDCSFNFELTSLDVSANTDLTYLECGVNQLTSLNVSQNTALTQLVCDNNQLSSLDVSQNTALIRLDCESNQLTSLNVSQNTALTLLYCQGNKFDCEALKKKYKLE
jgi:Leucine-rich repeat (LRR) protein